MQSPHKAALYPGIVASSNRCRDPPNEAWEVVWAHIAAFLALELGNLVLLCHSIESLLCLETILSVNGPSRAHWDCRAYQDGSVSRRGVHFPEALASWACERSRGQHPAQSSHSSRAVAELTGEASAESCSFTNHHRSSTSFPCIHIVVL